MPRENPFELCPRTPKNLEKAIENVIAKSEQVNYDPENDTNWCDLPKEMKEEVVKRMDFLSRIQFGVTAKDEKTLSEAEKYNLNGLEIKVNAKTITIRAYNIVGNRLLREEFSVQKARQNAVWVEQSTVEMFKKCEIQCFSHNSRNDDWVFGPEPFKKFAPFRFERLVGCDNMHLNLYFLRNCTSLQSIAIDTFRLGPRQFHDYNDLLDLPVICNVKHLELVNVKERKIVFKVIQRWLDSDAQIDKSIEVQMKETVEIASIAERFKKKIVKHSRRSVNIQMDDDAKQILIQGIAKNTEASYFSYFLIKVIPTGLPATEYNKFPFDKFRYSLPSFNSYKRFDDPKLCV